MKTAYDPIWRIHFQTFLHRMEESGRTDAIAEGLVSLALLFLGLWMLDNLMAPLVLFFAGVTFGRAWQALHVSNVCISYSKKID